LRSHDCIVLGVGGVGSAVLCHLARRGAKAMGIDRFLPPHDRGSSHGESRLIRQAYFEHHDYVPLLLRAYDLWAELERRAGRKLYHETGLLEVGPPGGLVVPGVLASARAYGLAVEEVPPRELERRFPGYQAPGGLAAALEPRAGYLRVEDCVRAHLDDAIHGGAELRVEEAIDWRADGDGFVVRTARAEHRAASLAITAGPWAARLLDRLGARLRVKRKPAFWLEPREPLYREEDGRPSFLYETPDGVFYGMPDGGSGLKVAEHTGGDAIEDPLAVDRSIHEPELERVKRFLWDHLPGAAGGRLLRHSVCLYTMSPDEHFIVGRHPEHERAVLAAGLSGHGFKFTSVLGEALADLALEGRTALPIGFLAPGRFLGS
jgi:monomeric sarcosine oxidase